MKVGKCPVKVMVAVKRVMDYSVPIRIKADGSGVETQHMKMVMNPFDEIAVEEAVRLKESGIATDILIISIGEKACQETLRSALAMGADRAILVETEQEIQPLAAAKVLHAIALQEKPQLIILGKQAIDTDDNQTGQMLAGLLQWPQGTFASQLNIQDQTVNVTREVDGGLETVQLTLPAVVTTDLRLNQPRYLTLPNIMQAKRKPITTIPLAELQMNTTPRIKTLAVKAPEKRRVGVIVQNVDELIDRLKNEARVIS